MLTKKQFLAGMELIEQSINQGRHQPLPKAALEVYYDAVRRLTLEQWRRVIREAIHRFRIRPTVCDLIELAGGHAENRTEAAWRLVYEAIDFVGRYRSVDFGDPAINAAIRDMGGWGRLCNVAIDQLRFHEQDFKERFDGYHQRGVPPELAGHLPGRMEADEIRRAGSAGWIKPVKMAPTWEPARIVEPVHVAAIPATLPVQSVDPTDVITELGRVPTAAQVLREEQKRPVMLSTAARYRSVLPALRRA